MPLPPEARRARRAAQKRAAGPKEFPRRHCANCNKMFDRTVPHKRFCSTACKDEFRRYGSAFGPLKTFLTKLIEERSKEEAGKQFSAYVHMREFRRELAAAGFIHRSMVKQRPVELRATALRASILMTGKLLSEIEARLIKRIERLEALCVPNGGQISGNGGSVSGGLENSLTPFELGGN